MLVAQVSQQIMRFGNVGMAAPMIAGNAYFPRSGVAIANNYFFPFANTKTILIQNTGVNPLLFGTVIIKDEASLPAGSPLVVPEGFGNGTAAAIVPTEGANCIRILAGGSLSIDIGSFQERGNFWFYPEGVYTAGPQFASLFPMTLIFFGIVGAAATTADICYINKLASF